MAVTASQIKSLNGKPRDKVLEKSDRDSLTIMVSKKGKISFYVRFRIKGKQQRMSLGSYPEMSLLEAREKVLEIKKDILNEKDPRSSRKMKTGLTLDECIQEWLTHRVDKQLGAQFLVFYCLCFLILV